MTQVCSTHKDIGRSNTQMFVYLQTTHTAHHSTSWFFSYTRISCLFLNFIFNFLHIVHFYFGPALLCVFDRVTQLKPKSWRLIYRIVLLCAYSVTQYRTCRSNRSVYKIQSPVWVNLGEHKLQYAAWLGQTAPAAASLCTWHIAENELVETRLRSRF